MKEETKAEEDDTENYSQPASADSSSTWSSYSERQASFTFTGNEIIETHF